MVRWPGNERVAVSFVVNFEEGAEFTLSGGDTQNEAVYEVTDRQNLPDPCIESHFEYGTRVGYWRIAELFDRYKGRFTLSSCGRAVEVSPWLARDAATRGHEVHTAIDGKRTPVCRKKWSAHRFSERSLLLKPPQVNGL